MTSVLGPFATRPWTQSDDEKLREMALVGANPRTIGLQMNRTEIAVRTRARRLGIVLKRPKRRSHQTGCGMAIKRETPQR